MKKERVDKLVVQAGITHSREQARRLIMSGKIYDQNDQRYDKPGEKIPTDRELYLKGKPFPYVSRGGLKLEKALDFFKIDITDHILLDIGASTGGFTDVALQKGARLSYALDVGYNQLAYSLRQDPRVVVMERQNFRYSRLEDFTKGQPTIASIDVSFISLSLILPPLQAILKKGASVIALIKPQFEAGPSRIGKKGVIKDPVVHQEVLEEVMAFITDIGFIVKDLTYSPITGGEGNIEYLVHLLHEDQPGNLSHLTIDIAKVVEESHQTFE
ncbi:TlyA family RNA methyltransferase [Facklamia miroungae]|uniref:23S rRNA (Cytidine1920-2'-O)/16S rRNA (Cytidine1409-2'-O)-methyltransferase n=1 Tax=Facklamia miroungae TaxID=120956 RepID=A0A1G7U3K9_9LACT|nr:TlyA family RNA methyltransferase [Facklamia miroungae]NKZ29892.1 TlyA family RNA methyltransferase [Facklamia miroungae]SDG41994.1 23S rRNA (cytidine1920-2'-O)/16S rRNA (cytidine1409-2'-O)-methyltransferase [Facklamia miroungae]